MRSVAIVLSMALAVALGVRLGTSLVGGTVHAQQPAPAQPVALDFEFFKTRVQPILLHKREGLARCYVCHSQGTPLVIQELSPGATMWSEEQSRKNFEVIRRVVVPGNPRSSRLLAMPLAAEAGGIDFHPGGKHWMTQNDPEFRVLVEFANGARTVSR
jgi:hypothetical protein